MRYGVWTKYVSHLRKWIPLNWVIEIKWIWPYVFIKRTKEEQGRIHGQHQLRTGGQGRKCAFSHFSTRVHGPTDRRTDGQTDKGSYRVACPQLKTKQENSFHRFKPFHQARRRNILTTTMINLGYVHSVDRNAQQNSKSWRTDSVWWLRQRERRCRHQSCVKKLETQEQIQIRGTTQRHMLWKFQTRSWITLLTWKTNVEKISFRIARKWKANQTASTLLACFL